MVKINLLKELLAMPRFNKILVLLVIFQRAYTETEIWKLPVKKAVLLNDSEFTFEFYELFHKVV